MNPDVVRSLRKNANQKLVLNLKNVQDILNQLKIKDPVVISIHVVRIISYLINILKIFDSFLKKKTVFLLVPPEDACLVSDLNKNSSTENIVLKKIGEKWRDGKCTTCSCDIINYKPMSQCMTKECPKIHDHPDFNDFVLEEIVFPYECCSGFEKTACKDNNQVYKVSNQFYSLLYFLKLTCDYKEYFSFINGI